MLPAELQNTIESILTEKSGIPVIIKESRALGGGCINEVYKLLTSEGAFLIKYNSVSAFPAMFEKEAAGLKLLAETKTVIIPEVISCGESGKQAFLLLQYIENGLPGRSFWNVFGSKLAELHRNTSSNFGLDHDNYIGSLHQSNKKHTDFISFFISERIEPQLKEARNKGAFSQGDSKYFDSLFKSLHNIIPPENPSLVHGDLWNGNFMVDQNGSPCLIDPAVYYGHREADIAMTQLFGGFQPEFYHAYNLAWPMEINWQKRMDIFNLYPLLVHVNLFGGGYAGQVLRIIRQF